MNNFWICPLYNFKSTIKSVDFNEGFQIIPSLKELKHDLSDIYNDWLDVSDFDFMVVLPQINSFSLETDIEKKITELLKVHLKLFKFITAIRLCHNGEIIPGPLISAQTITTSTEEKYSFDTHGWQNIPTDFGYLYGLIDLANFKVNEGLLKTPIYRLSKLDVPSINNIMSKISNGVSKSPVIDEVLKRFNSSYYGNAQDKLIDQMVAFESLYIGDDKELGYKLRLRTAFLLNKNRGQIFQDMKDAYDLRGNIMHGNEKINLKKVNATEPIIKEYLRQSINKFLTLLTQEIQFKEIKNKLDENILTNGKTFSIKP
jgi:hypothetical protein